MAKKCGYKLIIITNQSGIARGYYTELDFYTLNTWMLGVLEEQGVDIDAVYFCPHHPKGKVDKYRVECDCRKPKTGLFREAVEAFNLKIDKCYTIGDKIRDCSICESTGCKGYLIGETEAIDIINSVKAGDYRNVDYAEDLLCAVRRLANL